MTGPIKGRPIQPGQPVQPATTPPETAAPKKAEFGAVQPASQRVEQAIRQNFDAVRGRIHEGLRCGLNKSEILRELARGELTDMFGTKPSERMVLAVADAVANDPNFAQVYGKLFSRASSDSA